MRDSKEMESSREHGLSSEAQLQDHQRGNYQQEQQPHMRQDQQKQQRQLNQCRKKLRESCNNCAISKVKCSKEQPVCARCEDRGIFCHYGLSRRTGKRRRGWTLNSIGGAANINSKGSNSPNFDFQQDMDQSIPTGDACAFEFQSDLCQDIFPRITSAPTSKRRATQLQMPKVLDDTAMSWNDSLFAVDFDVSNFDDSMADCSSSYTDIDMFVQPSNLTVNSSNFESLLRVLGHSDSMTPESTTPTPVPHSQSRSCTFASHDDGAPSCQPKDCMTISLNTLQSLHMAPHSCSSLSAQNSQSPSLSSPTPTIDDVLTTNKSIIESMGAILDCSCSLDTQLCLVLTLIATKIISWYRAIARSDDLETNDSVAKSSNIGSMATAERVMYVPITVGKYHLDGADKGKMHAQLVLSELHRVVKLVEQLAKRFREASQMVKCGEGIDLKDDLTGRERVVSTICTELEAFLRSRVRSVTRQTMELLRER